jgi:hypothetical protein
MSKDQSVGDLILVDLRHFVDSENTTSLEVITLLLRIIKLENFSQLHLDLNIIFYSLGEILDTKSISLQVYAYNT